MLAIRTALAGICAAWTCDFEVDAVRIVLSTVFAVLILSGVKCNDFVAEDEVARYTAWDGNGRGVVVRYTFVSTPDLGF